MIFLKEYEFITSVTFNVGVSAFYLALVYFLKRVNFNVGPIIPFYNLTQIVFCGYMAYRFIGDMSGITITLTPEVEMSAFFFFISKYLDLFDTVIIVLKKNFRQLTFLHLFHHVSIIFFSITLIQNEYGFTDMRGSVFNIFLYLLNTLVHFFMYGHYFITSYGIRNPFKIIITKLQIIQFFIAIGVSIGLLITNHEINNVTVHSITIVYMMSMILLFGNFFFKNY